MDWNNVAQRAKQVKAPGIDIMSKTHVQSMENLIARLEEADAAEARRVRRGMVLFAIGGALLGFAFFMSLAASSADAGARPPLHTGFLALLYAGIALMAWRAWRRLAAVDYAAPVRAFLQAAEKRYRLVILPDVVMSLPLVIVLLLAIYTGGTYVAGVMTRYVGPGHEPLGLVVYGAILAAAAGVGIVATKADWERKKAPLWREIRRMITELSHEETGSGGTA